jgi:hypothetical protein
VARFRRLFGDAILRAERAEPTRLRLALRADARVAARAAKLAADETTCCTFFTFTLRFSGEGLTLDVTVPAAYTDTLDALAAPAARASSATVSGETRPISTASRP